MFLKLKKELLLKYLFLFVLLFACTAGICSASYIVIITLMICGVVMTSSAFESAISDGAKYESLVLDMIEMMEGCLAFEVRRDYEFAPIKNRHGVDSLDSAREMMQKIGIEL